MNSVKLIICWAVLVVSTCALFASDVSAPLSPTNRVIQLFNGKDLSGFYTWLVDTKREDPRRVFTVTNGMIHVSGDGLGYLSTEREYQNYRLSVEFKWGERNWTWGDRIGKTRDSGIFLHSIGPDGNSHDGQGAFKAAIECQIMQGAVGDLLLIRGTNFDGSLIAPKLTVPVGLVRTNPTCEPIIVDGKTRGYAMTAGKYEPLRDVGGWPYWSPGGKRLVLERWGRVNWQHKDPDWKDVLDRRNQLDIDNALWGEWTRVECLCDEGRIQIRVNGKLVNEALDVYPRCGKILLQCEGSEIYFRRLELHPLPRAAHRR
ncbi:MAG: DUF1080 domain-containing protein [Verrucomicrobia bacterium]|nr:DUF1080 domain-containing protein [Verrucomicrobiota bacterium]